MGCRIGDESDPGRNGRHPGVAALTEGGSLPGHESTVTHTSNFLGSLGVCLMSGGHPSGSDYIGLEGRGGR